MPGLSPRSHARDRGLAAKPTQESDADQGYFMMEKTALGSRSKCAAPASPNQATGATLPSGSSQENLKDRSHSPDTFIGHYSYRGPTKHRARSSLPATSDPRPRSNRQSIPIGHALGNGLVQPIFRPASQRSPLVCFPSLSRRDAGLKMLCVIDLLFPTIFGSHKRTADFLVKTPRNVYHQLLAIKAR